MATQRLVPLTLTPIVATSSTLGIGIRGALPWRLKAELQYFARVTTRVPPPDDPYDDNRAAAATTEDAEPPPAQNAVIMGRRTWDSIPARLRPLRGRLNVVLSRAAGFEPATSPSTSTSTQSQAKPAATVLTATSLEAAVARLAARRGAERVARAFVIGGAEAYRAALEGGAAETVLVTKVKGEWECDAFFPADLDAAGAGWRRCSAEEWAAYTGEPVERARGEEGGTEWECVMYRRDRA
jgi:dihydrofolate reductase